MESIMSTPFERLSQALASCDTTSNDTLSKMAHAVDTESKKASSSTEYLGDMFGDLFKVTSPSSYKPPTLSSMAEPFRVSEAWRPGNVVQRAFNTWNNRENLASQAAVDAWERGDTLSGIGHSIGDTARGLWSGIWNPSASDPTKANTGAVRRAVGTPQDMDEFKYVGGSPKAKNPYKDWVFGTPQNSTNNKYVYSTPSQNY